MIRVRRVEDVAIIDWSHKDVATVVPRIRALVDAREASRVLLNMAEVESLKGEGLETLTEALSVCEDGGCALGMYGLNTYLTKLLEIMNLHAVMPTLLGPGEGEALSRVRTLTLPKERTGAPQGGEGGEGEETPDPDVELDFDAQETPEAPPVKSPEAVVEFEFDAPAAPERQTRPAPASPQKSPPLAATLRFDKAAVAQLHDSPEDILGIAWAELASQGITLGGPGAREIMARAAGDAHPAPAPEAEKAATRPTQRIPSQVQPQIATATTGDLEIDLEVSPSPDATPPPAKPREYKTEVIKTFDLTAHRAADGTAAPGEDSSDETESLEVDFEPVRAEELGLGAANAGFMGANAEEAKGLFGGDETNDGESPEWSPVDTEVRRPAAAAPLPAPSARGQTPPSPVHSRPAPAPPPQPAARPPQTPPAARPAVARQAPPPPLPVPPPRPAPAPVAYSNYEGDGGDETVMFQPDALLAEVLAAVTPDAPPVASAPAATNLDLQLRDTHKEAPKEAPVAEAPAPAPVAATPRAPDTHEEFRQFLADYAIVSELHLRVLERFSREGIEKVLGRSDVQSAVGGSPAGVSAIIEDFVQARLLKRRRSPRVRGGIGFLYSPSPKTRNAVTRLLRLYEDGKTRAEVIGWMTAARQAAGA